MEWVFAAGDNHDSVGWFNDSAGWGLSLPDADHDPPSPQRAVESAAAPAVHSAARRYPTRNPQRHHGTRITETQLISTSAGFHSNYLKEMLSLSSRSTENQYISN